MKRKLFKSLLAVALFCVGSNAWATLTVVKSWDFDAATDAVSAQTVLSYSGSTTINKTSCDNLTGDFSGIAVQGGGNWHIYHTNSKGVLQGNGYYNNNSGGRLLGLLDLKAGDIVHITATGGLANTATNGTYDNTNSTEGTDCYYTVTADGHFAVSVARYYYIHTVTVTRDLADIEAPGYLISGANGVQREVTLNCLTPDAVIKYNTTDDKTASGWTTYSAPFMTSESTLYAYSEKSGNSSDVITIATGAGEAITLNAPTISTAFVSNGSMYNPNYSFSSNQSGVVFGTPALTYSYSFNGGASVEGTSFAPASNGSLTVTVSAAGYTSNSTTLSVFGGDFVKTYSFDAINDVTVDTENGEWTNPSNVNSAQWTFTSSANATYTLRDDISISGFMYARATTAKTKQGFYARVSRGTINFTLASGEAIAFTTLNGLIVANSSETPLMVDQYTNVRAIDIYSPNYPVSVSSVGWATLYTPYALNFEGTGLTAYTATCDGSTVTLTEVDDVPANTGVVLKGTAGGYSIPTIASSSTAKGDLTGSATEATAYNAVAEKTLYVLALNGSGKVQFQPVNEGSIAAGKAYLALTPPLLA